MSEEVQEIIDKLCKANQFSQSKVTGLLVEEALRSRGVLNDSFSIKILIEIIFQIITSVKNHLLKIIDHQLIMMTIK